MRALVAGLVTRQRVIAVIGARRADVERAICHARGADASLPIWAYCADDLPEDKLPENTGRPANCARFVSGRDALGFRKDLRSVWPALSIIAWTGTRAPAALKLGAFVIPPFRVLVLNEAGDFFAATPAAIARHVTRRTRDASISHARRTVHWGAGIGAWTRSLVWRAGQRMVDVLRLIASLAWRASQRVVDVCRLMGSLAWRAGERIRDVFDWAWQVFLQPSPLAPAGHPPR